MNTNIDTRGIVVMKFGGSSLATKDHIDRAAWRVLRKIREGARPVVVVSAIGQETNALKDLGSVAQSTSEVGQAEVRAQRREMDVLLACGEQKAAALFASTLQRLGVVSRSMTGGQIALITDECFGDASILEVQTKNLLDLLQKGVIPVVTGFQGVTYNGEITTLGRGGSDTTAVALAAALGPVVCEIYKDVDGVYDADPHRHPGAIKLPFLTYDDMSLIVAEGARVLHHKAALLAKIHGVPLYIQSSFQETKGTWVGLPSHYSHAGGLL